MCRLLGLHGGGRVAKATFWLVQAPVSLQEQSKRQPEGAGIGSFGFDGKPFVDKRPVAAYQDLGFLQSSHDQHGTTFVAHVRYASTGDLRVENTHPFCQDGRLFAHNGAFLGLPELEARLDSMPEAAGLVQGDTDSERMFALITAETRRHGGDVRAGLTAAISWIAQELPVYSLNLLLATDTDMWALRYPETNELYVLERAPTKASRFEEVSRRIKFKAPELREAATVVFASERMDDDEGWRLLDVGELVHVGPGPSVDTSAFHVRLEHPLTLADLEPVAAASQSD